MISISALNPMTIWKACSRAGVSKTTTEYNLYGVRTIGPFAAGDIPEAFLADFSHCPASLRRFAKVSLLERGINGERGQRKSRSRLALELADNSQPRLRLFLTTQVRILHGKISRSCRATQWGRTCLTATRSGCQATADAS